MLIERGHGGRLLLGREAAPLSAQWRGTISTATVRSTLIIGVYTVETATATGGLACAAEAV